MATEDLASVLFRFDNGATGNLSVGQVCAGHKNDLALEVCGASASVSWRQEQPNELWIGHRDRGNEIVQKDPSLVDRPVRPYTRLPGGHQEGWADAFCNVMRDIYDFIAAGKNPGDPHPPAFATFEDRLPGRPRGGGDPRECEGGWHLDDRMTIRPFAPSFMRVGILTAALQELTPRSVRDANPDRAIEDWLAFAGELGADTIQLSAALHPADTDVPAEAMLDPVANTLDLRSPFDTQRAGRARAACRATGVDVSISATSTTCCTTIRRCGGRSTSSWFVCSMRRCSSASTPCAASSAATCSAAWIRI